MRKSYALDNIPLVEAAYHGDRQRPTAIIIRTSWTTGDGGAANAIAQTWHNPNNRVDSCHYVVDEKQTIRCVPDKVEAFDMEGGWKNAISINVCHDPPSAPTIQTLSRAAKLTARLCKHYRIRVRILSDLEAAKWMKHSWKHRGGIILSTSGHFPITTYYAFVENDYKKLTNRA